MAPFGEWFTKAIALPATIASAAAIGAACYTPIATGAKAGAVVGGPVGALSGAAVGALCGLYTYMFLQKPIDAVVENVVVNPIVAVANVPIKAALVVAKLFEKKPEKRDDLLPDEDKPFAGGDARPNTGEPTSFKVVATETSSGKKKVQWQRKPAKLASNQNGDPKKKPDKNGEDPECRNCISNDSDELEQLLETLSKILDDIRSKIGSQVSEDDLVNNLVNLFRQLINGLQKLIHEHGAEFQRSERGIELIAFRANQLQNPPTIFLNKEIQDFFKNMVTIFSNINANIVEQNLDFKGIIYCIQCQLCQNQEFNYVGQSVTTMEKRGRQHVTVIKTNVGHQLHVHLINEHAMNENEINTDTLSNSYKIFLIHDLQDNATSPKSAPSCKRGTDSRIRRCWEMFYQWAFKAIHFDGGGSIR